MLDEDSKQWLKDSLIYNDNNFNKESLEQLKSFSQEKFIQILAEIKEGICHIRSFDFPLHELFDNELEKEKYKNIFEFNPMLGNRGCRLSIIFSEIFIMQLQALLDAYVVSGKKAKLGIMLPMVADVNEILFLKNLIFDTISSNENYSGIVLDIGSMIETPRAMFTINEIAKHVDFLSIGTNDLTQMSWGISRDDSHFYLPEYLSKKIIRDNPFIKFDRDGMYDVLFEAINRARKANFKVKIGFCGEQANDRESLEMFLSMDIDFVSVSPKKVLQTLYFCSKDF
jgi:pyruvate,orthophosphate dikinase